MHDENQVALVSQREMSVDLDYLLEAWPILTVSLIQILGMEDNRLSHHRPGWKKIV